MTRPPSAVPRPVRRMGLKSDVSIGSDPDIRTTLFRDTRFWGRLCGGCMNTTAYVPGDSTPQSNLTLRRGHLVFSAAAFFTWTVMGPFVKRRARGAAWSHVVSGSHSGRISSRFRSSSISSAGGLRQSSCRTPVTQGATFRSERVSRLSSSGQSTGSQSPRSHTGQSTPRYQGYSRRPFITASDRAAAFSRLIKSD